MTFVFAGIAAWLVVSIVVGLVFARALTLKEGDDSLKPAAQLRLVREPGSKGERAA